MKLSAGVRNFNLSNAWVDTVIIIIYKWAAGPSRWLSKGLGTGGKGWILFSKSSLSYSKTHPMEEAVGALPTHVPSCLPLQCMWLAFRLAASAWVSLPGYFLSEVYFTHVAVSRAEGLTSCGSSAQQTTDKNGVYIPQGGVTKFLSTLAPGVPW